MIHLYLFIIKGVDYPVRSRVDSHHTVPKTGVGSSPARATYLVNYSLEGDPLAFGGAPEVIAAELQLNGSNVLESYIFAATQPAPSLIEPRIIGTIPVTVPGISATLRLINRTPGGGLGHLAATTAFTTGKNAITASITVVRLTP
ncbi:hypothetical protein [Aneurinibacillus migulanus]|uniref:hypothetical protein n=1 Tax=Aneurinibacillus migulanus TaxID=47500 RepID=UPI001F220471|nr:hypothetical protein [Aneurinibacillus migulanus]